MHVSPSGDTHTKFIYKFKSTSVGLKPTTLGSVNTYIIGSALSFDLLPFLSISYFPHFISALLLPLW